MTQTVSEMFGYERESDDDTIIDNYADSSSDISMPSVFTNELSPIVITRITITCNIIPKLVNVSIMTVFSY